MKVIVTVISLLMVLMLITISQIKSHTVNLLMRKEAQRSLVYFESEWSKRSARKAYKSAASEKPKKDDSKKEEGDKKTNETRLNRRYSLKPLYTAIQKQEASEASQRLLLQRLIQKLFAKESFYIQFLRQQEAEGRREEQVIQQFIESIIKHLEENQGKKIELEKVHFEEENYRNTFAKMLGGRDGLYYPDLRSYLDTKKTEQRISVYLADRVLLWAIFGNEVLVDEVMQVRSEIYRDLLSDRVTKEAGEERLRALVPETEFHHFLSFKVSKTKPSQKWRPVMLSH